MTIFSPQKFHQKAKNPRKRPILSKFVVPKVPEVYGCRAAGFGCQDCGFPRGFPAVLATERDKKLGIRVHRSIFFEK